MLKILNWLGIGLGGLAVLALPVRAGLDPEELQEPQVFLKSLPARPTGQ